MRTTLINKRALWTKALLTLGMLFGPTSFSATSQPQLNAVTLELPPYSTKLADGSHSGVAIELFRAVLEEINASANITTYPWKRSLNLAKQGAADIVVPCSPKEERRDYLYFSDPLNQGEAVIATLSRSSLAGKTKTMEHLAILGKGVGVSAGYVIENHLNNAGVEGYTRIFTDSSILQMLETSRIQAYVGYRSSLQQLLIQAGLEKENYLQLHDLFKVDYGFCVSKQKPDAKALLERLNMGIKKIRANGKFDAIMEKYIRPQ